MKERLDTDRVNYLVWRYLIESNYRETATKLQKEWRQPLPHTSLEFAPHVSHHALVTLLNKGLALEGFERDYEAEARQVPHAVSGVYGVVSRGVFGPLMPDTATQAADADGEADAEGEDEDEMDDEPYPGDAADESQNPRKRPSDGHHHALLIGSPAKRPKLTNGLENGAGPNGAQHGTDAVATTPMEIDQDHDAQDNNRAYPSPLEGEQAASPTPRTDGPEQGTQVPRVVELKAKDTTYLLTGPDGLWHGSPLPEALASQPPAENPVVLHCEWSPADPSILAAAGADALARLWNVSQHPGSSPIPSIPLANHVNGNPSHFTDMQVAAHFKKATITAMAWNPAGDTLALAMEDGTLTHSHCNTPAEIIGTWSITGGAVDNFDGPGAPILKIRWNPNGQSFFCISTEKNGGALLTLYSLNSNAKVGSWSIPDLDLELVDALWASEAEMLICGGDVLVSVQVTPDGLVEGRTFVANHTELLTHLGYDLHTRFVAAASEKGLLHVWNEAGEQRTFNAHIGMISAVQWQPLQTAPASGDERLLASSGTDGAISVWNVRSPDTKAKFSMTMDLPVIGISITPDGEFIAGATSRLVLVWKVGEHAFPYASWNSDPARGWLSPQVSPQVNPQGGLSPKTNGAMANGGSDEEYVDCLAWNVNGRKLIYGANSRLVVIHFR